MKIPKFLEWLVARADAADAEDAKPAEPKAEATNPAASPAAAAIQKVREDLTAFGTAIGVGSTLVLGATGVATFDSMFPMPPGTEPWAVTAVVLAVAGSVGLTVRFFRAKRRILINTMDYATGSTRLQSIDEDHEALYGGVELSPTERKFVQARLQEFAVEEGVRDVPAVEARAERLARIVVTSKALGQKESAAYAADESARVSSGLREAIAEAALLVIERRSAAVYGGWLTVAFALMAALGTGGVFLLADWSKGERELTEAWVACHKDLKGKDGEDPAVRSEVCGALRRPTTQPPAASGSPSESSRGTTPASASAVPTPGTELQQLEACVSRHPRPTSVPSALWERALASCAGLPAPSPSATASTTP